MLFLKRLKLCLPVVLELTKQVMQTIEFYKNNTVATIRVESLKAMTILRDDTDGFVRYY